MQAVRLILTGLACAALTSAPLVGRAQSPPAYPGVFNVCRGEFENFCKRHPYEKFERCGTYGVNGVNWNLSCQAFCGKPLGSQCTVVQNAAPTAGNACGYAWFKVTCR
jgi:hypothetical protein